MKCQLKYHPRIHPSIGLTDGENLERLWSYLGRFAVTTKYMRPSHRLDILELAIQNISERMIFGLGEQLNYEIIIYLYCFQYLRIFFSKF
jgi:hypothetical protein